MSFERVTRGKPITSALIDGTPRVRVQQAITIERRLRNVEIAINAISGSVDGAGVDGPPAGGIFDTDKPPPVAVTGSAGTNGLIAQGNHTHVGVTTIGKQTTGTPTPGPLELAGAVTQSGALFTFGGSYADHVIADGAFTLITGAQTDLVIAEYGFLGTDFYPRDAIEDIWRIYRSRTGTGTITLELYDITNGPTQLALYTLTTAAGPIWEVAGASFTGALDAGPARVQLRATIATGGDTLTLHAHAWARRGDRV